MGTGDGGGEIMSEKWTRIDADNLTDILWWLKGFIAGAKEAMEYCPFSTHHTDALSRAKRILNERIEHETIQRQP